MTKRRLAAILLAIGAVSFLGGCKIVSTSDESVGPAKGFDAVSYAADLWEERILPLFRAEARPAAPVLAAIAEGLDAAGETHGYRPGEGAPWAFVISGTGTVQAINTKSRAGTLDLALEETDPPLVVTLQIGPVIRGNAIRDALPFVSFKDFTNQLDFAEAGKAITALAAEGFAATLEGLAVGDRVSFSGALTLTRASDKVQVTPVLLEELAP